MPTWAWVLTGFGAAILTIYLVVFVVFGAVFVKLWKEF